VSKQNEKAMKLERLASLDAFRGFDILVMIFVNYIAGMAGVPFILRHAPAQMDAFTLTDVVFPGFLFIDVGRDLGSHSAIVVAGILVGTLFPSGTEVKKPKERIMSMGVFGIGLCFTGYLLRPLHGFSKIQGTESYCLVTSGICCLLFLFFYVLMDVLKIRRWSSFLQPIGQNPLLAYILPSLMSYVISFASTGLILLITWAMTRAKIILKI
jgi:predicted acyltransferase